jgi:hypothetical protein
MRRTLLAVTLAATPLVASAAETGPGCGWGAILMDGQDGLAPNVLAATTNGTFGNQTFGLTSGTAGCDSSQTIQRAAVDFLDDNMEKVARDMSSGQGESLDTLANLMGVQPVDKAAFFALTHDNFSSIFTTQAVSSTEVMANLQTVIKQDPALAHYAG